MPTPSPTPAAPDADATLRVDSDRRPPSYPRGPQAQFAPGTMIGGRYRIAGILGSGGMGEVYRADDVKLDQAVALKFLPARLARDPVLLARLHDEVRLGRQVAHPNVCRIYDIVESDGAQFVAMEFVDGEDLSRLLRRIGRLAHDKAVDIARGIAAGLAAAHAKGILHRDLKPANVMIDSHGEARIMDFGLALAAGEDDGTISGTPAYMAPEQFDGAPATIQSDLYSLGLVMYELFTGKRAHEAQTMPERVRAISSEITTPSSVIRDIDPAVERIILRCLNNDPAQRPRNAREVIESLPGGDPLAAALAAGETPSPGMVAAAGTEGRLSLAAAWSMLGFIALLFAAALVMRRDLDLSNFMPQPQSPAVLQHRAEELLRELGVQPKGSPVAELRRHDTIVAWVNQHDVRMLRNGPSPLFYRLRYGVDRDRAMELHVLTAGRGLASIDLDPRGRLTMLVAAPPERWTERGYDPHAVLRAAGFDPAAMKRAGTTFAPPVPFDRYEAWSGTYPGDATPVRAELASWHGTPTFFRVTGAWDDAGQPEFAFERRAAVVYIYIILIAITAGGAVLAWRNFKLRRGDRQSAWRLAALLFTTSLVSRLLRRGVRDDAMSTVDLAVRSIGEALFIGVGAYLLYIAIEPVIRRRWPRQLTSWVRLVSGRWRDPMVGRDLLVGVGTGLVHAGISLGAMWLAIRTNGTQEVTVLDTDRFTSMRHTAAAIASGISAGPAQAMLVMSVLTGLTIVLRKRMLAALGVFAMGAAAYFFAAGGGLATTLMLGTLAAIQTTVAVRYGLLAFAVAQSVFAIIFFVPPIDAPWTLPMVIVPYVVVVALAVWGFLTSLGGQSPLPASWLEE